MEEKRSGITDNESLANDDRCRHNAEEACAVKSVEGCLDLYKNWSAIYDEDFSSKRYRAPELLVEVVEELFATTSKEDRGKLKVLDVAAGTGKVGGLLHAIGFRDLCALDPSEDMLSVLKQKGIYTSTVQELISADKPTSIPMDSFDLVTSAGSFVPGHLPVSACDEMARVCKPEGHVVISMRLDFLRLPEYQGLEQHTKDMERQGVWDLREKHILPNYYFDDEGVVFVFQKN